MFDIHLSFRCTLFSKETRISDRLRQKGKIFKVRLDWLKLDPDVSVQKGNLYPPCRPLDFQSVANLDGSNRPFVANLAKVDPITLLQSNSYIEKRCSLLGIPSTLLKCFFF